MRSLRPLTVALLTGAVSLGTVPLAYATFGGSVASTSSFSAAALAPPSAVGVVRTCSPLTGASFTVTWFPSTTDWAQGQRVELRGATGLLLDSEDLPATATSAALTVPLLALSPSYTVTVRATYAAWSSPAGTGTAPGC